MQGISGSGRVTTRAWDAGARTLYNWVDDEMNPAMTIVVGLDTCTTYKECERQSVTYT